MKKIQTIKIGRKQFYNVEMLSKMLSIPVETVRAYIRRNRLRAIKVGKRYLVSEENLQRFLDGGEQVREIPKNKESDK
ncbi:DNA-binding protein [Candidatus Atribacteria bacterium 1244-E10-H5-B2]|nr:MAG: DNA-binding protein [Candidatus Atribacteria bacterium 1244-E10-H5-B2]